MMRSTANRALLLKCGILNVSGCHHFSEPQGIVRFMSINKNVLIKKKAPLTESDVTPEAIYRARRQFMKGTYITWRWGYVAVKLGRGKTKSDCWFVSSFNACMAETTN
ncbi:hypothetical protein P4S72_19580 [Vibrio sp. PP-XX7]